MTRGTRAWRFNSLRSKRLAACVLGMSSSLGVKVPCAT
jgi:hypothetical protein